MAETQQYTFDYHEVAEALIKKQGIHEGLWGIYIEFSIGACMIPRESSKDILIPAAIVPVHKIGIQRFNEPNSLTVDAAVMNPLIEVDSPTSAMHNGISARKKRKVRVTQEENEA